jgi:tripartite-type tricarboxylate transporter receptor subunit TctC
MKALTLRLAGVVSCVVVALTTSGVFAQNYPNKPIRMIVPFAAGGNNDVRARIIAENLTRNLGQPVVVENKPGVDGAIGMEMVAKAKADGYTLLAIMTGAATVTPSLYKNVRYDTMKDFDQIIQLNVTPMFLMVHASLPVKTVKELIALAKSKPGQLNYGTSSSTYYLTTEDFKQRTGTDITYIPYKGTAPAMTAFISGETQMMIESLFSYLPLIKAGKIRPIAVCSSTRSPALPDVPTMAESGIPDFIATQWSGLAAPAGTPREIIKRLNAEIVRILSMPAVKERLENAGDTIVGNTPEEFTAFIQAELTKFARVIKDAGIPRIDQ